MPPTIRPYRPEDRAAASLVYFRAIHEGTAGLYDDAQRMAWAPSPIPDLLTSDKLSDQWCWVAEEDGVVLGGCGIYPTSGLPQGCAELVKFYLSAKSRKSGLG